MATLNVQQLPAVIDGKGMVDTIIGIEKGRGFNLGGTIRTLTVMIGVLIGLFLAMAIGALFEAIIGNDGVAFFIFLISAAGIGYVVWQMGKQLFPNVEEAKRALTTGEIPLDQILEGLNAREPGNAEKELLAGALSTFDTRPDIEFDSWYVVPSSLAITYCFGRVLIISREALDSPDLSYILAHEFGHLNNGDGFVRSAIWSLGKDFFGTENITLFGSVADDDKKGDYNVDELSNLGRSLSQKDWVSSLAQAISIALNSSGKGVKIERRPIRDFFKKWDMGADKFALDFVDPDEYLRYISELEQFERGTGEGPFNAPAIHRFDAVNEAIETGHFPTVQGGTYRAKPWAAGNLSVQQVTEHSEAIENSLAEMKSATGKYEVRMEIKKLGPNASAEEINKVLDKHGVPWI